MSVVDALTREFVRRQTLGLGTPKHIVLSPIKWHEFGMECIGMMRFTEPSQAVFQWRFMGVPVSMENYSMFCRTCGAPAETPECSYCHSPSEYIRIE